jgi:hypothetical protein
MINRRESMDGASYLAVRSGRTVMNGEGDRALAIQSKEEL